MHDKQNISNKYKQALFEVNSLIKLVEQYYLHYCVIYV